MLEWLEEGDRMGETPPKGGITRLSGAHHTFESPRRRERFLIGGGVVVAVGLVLVLRLAGNKAKHEEAAAQAVAVPSAAPALVAAAAEPSPAAPVADPA